MKLTGVSLIIAIVVSILFVVACGGGNVGDAPSAAVKEIVPTDTPEPTSAPDVGSIQTSTPPTVSMVLDTVSPELLFCVKTALGNELYDAIVNGRRDAVAEQLGTVLPCIMQYPQEANEIMEMFGLDMATIMAASTPIPSTETPSPTHTPVPQPTNTPEPTTTDVAWDILVGDIEPVHGKGVPPATGSGLGPWATRIMLASSEDGINFERTGEIVADQAGVPNMILDHDGRIRVYYVAWQQYGSEEGADGNFIAVAVRTSLGEWTYHRVNVKGGSFRSSLVDPYVVSLDDGRYRLYFMADTGSFNLRIFSATSDDGVHFVIDKGERFGSGDPVYDPAVLKVGAGWQMWMGPDGSSSATSRDGLDFTSTGPFTVEGRSFMAWSAVSVPAGGYRLYGSFPGPGGSGDISSVFSEDGENWDIEPGARLSAQGADPALESQFAADNGLAISSDGTYMLAYLVAIP